MTDTLTLDEILDAITSGQFTNDDLRQINNLAVGEIKANQQRDARRTIATLVPGDTVKVIPGKLRNSEFDGLQTTVTKVFRTNVAVKNPFRELGTVKIPASVLEKVDD